MTSSNSLEALQLNIEKIALRIDKVVKELVAAEQSGAADKASFLRATALELHEEEHELRKKKNSMMQAQILEVQTAAAKAQTQAMLQLAKSVSSLALSIKLARLTQFVYTPSGASCVQDPDFKVQLIKAYQQSSYDEARNKPCQTCKCMVLGVSLPTGYVTASHLFKFKWHLTVQEFFGFVSVYNPRNGLLLAQ